MEISLHNQQDKIAWNTELEQIINSVGQQVARRQGLGALAEAAFVLVDNEQIREINRQYRNKDSVTDVISFALNDEDDEPAHPDSEWMLGDVYISIERAKAQAEELGHSFTREVGYLAVHGLLHLLGFSHDEEQKRQEMRLIEEEVLSAIELVR